MTKLRRDKPQFWYKILAINPRGLIVSKCWKVGVKMWFKWTKYSDKTNCEPKVLYERNQRHWNVFRVRFTWSKYLCVAAFLRPKYQNSLVMKIYKRCIHHVTCLANMADTNLWTLWYNQAQESALNNLTLPSLFHKMREPEIGAPR